MKLRAFSFVLLLASALLLLASCDPSQKTADGSTVPATEGQTYTLRANDEGKAENGRIEAFYTVDAPGSVTGDAVAKYVAEGHATGLLSTLCSDCDEVASVPVLGTYLEKTSLFVCLFQKQGELIGTHAVAVDADGNVTGELCDLLGDTVGTPLADAACFERISACLSLYPGFEMQGVVYREYGVSTVYPVGKNAGDDRVLYYDNEPTEFGLVEPFATIEDGRAAFDAWRDFRAGEIKKIPVYEWTTVPSYPTRNYLMQSAGIFDSDWQLLVPLLNADGRENEFILLLCYRKDRLIAETVMRLFSDGARVVKGRVSDKDTDTGKYVGLNGIDYASACRRILPSDGTNVRGIGFDGENYFVVYR